MTSGSLLPPAGAKKGRTKTENKLHRKFTAHTSAYMTARTKIDAGHRLVGAEIRISNFKSK